MTSDPSAPQEPSVRVDIALVAYGDGPRVRACLESLLGHASRFAFRIHCVINPDSRSDPQLADFPAGVIVHRPLVNLGWAGALHVVRNASEAEFLVWAQDDMVVADGWLDALVTTADRYPDAGAVGSVEVDPATRLPNGYAGGYAEPPDRVGLWNLTDALRSGAYRPGDPLDWVTSKGMLTRRRAWDDVGGTDPRLFPLNHVDKEYSVHLRAHGWRLYVAPDAHIIHEKHRSAPMSFRGFLAQWQEPDFDRAWGPIATALGSGESSPVSHPCPRAHGLTLDEVEQQVGREASRLLVPFARHAATTAAELESELRATRQTLSWRVTAPLRFLRRSLRRGGQPSGR